MEAWTTIRFLHANGTPVKAIARQLKVSRNTVRKALRATEPPRYERSGRPNPQLEPFREAIATMLLGPEPLVGSRILKEIRVKGYQGSKTALYEFLRRLRAEAAVARKTRVRFETGPGEQAQFDWSPYRVMIGGAPTGVVIYRNILGFSRLQALWASRDQTWMSVSEALEESFTFFGGVPKGEVVDNDRCFITGAFPNGTWNQRWLEFCGHYALRPIPCSAYHPESKGKVEQPFQFLENHLIKGHQWTTWEAFCSDLGQFQDRVNHRVHGTTREVPLERFERERGLLTPLPTRRFVATGEEWRTVSWDCLVPWQGSRTEVPPVQAGRRVRVRTSQGTWLQLFDAAGERIAVHRLTELKGATVLGPAQGLPRQRTPRTRVLLEQRFRERFPEDEAFLQALCQAHEGKPATPLRAVLHLAAVYPAESMRWAFGVAMRYRTLTPGFIAGLLSNVAPETVAPDAEAYGRIELPYVEVHRDLRDYDRAAQAGDER